MNRTDVALSGLGEVNHHNCRFPRRASEELKKLAERIVAACYRRKGL